MKFKAPQNSGTDAETSLSDSDESAGRLHLPSIEERIIQYWRKHDVFKRSVSEKPETQNWSFYDGPPFATGLPHYGHLLAGTIKDVVPRYWTMRGKRVARRFGWDCHGLPIEFELEKELGLKGRKDIENYGVDKFNEACRGIVLRYTREWRKTVERMGRWVDFDNDYKTMDSTFMESVWAVFHKLWAQGLVYEDKKVQPYSTRITTPLSNFEANLNYKEVQDPSIIVKMELVDEPKTYILAWTTTPWTLPVNLAVAVNPEFEYVKILDSNTNEKYILFSGLLKNFYKDPRFYSVIETKRGSELKGLRYKQLIRCFESRIPPNAHQVLTADFVTADTGTGIVHIAPSFGEDDFALCKENGIAPLDHLDDEGVITSACPEFAGMYIKDADKPIIQQLKTRGLLYHQSTIQHRYPFCYRSDTPLIYRAIPTWFVRVTAIKEQLVANNQKIHWVPEHLKDGRFGNWLEGARDWAISRNRFWGNPLPIWRNEETGETMCLGSIAELEKLSGQKVPDIHKHFIDSITFKSPKTGAIMKRVPEILDCWFESGSMPYAQNHYPFSMPDREFDKIFPAEFIAEGLDQTRGWFYTLLVLSTALEKGPAFKNVIVNGIVLAEDGKKMSKSLKNYPDPNHVLDAHGADALRIYLLQSGAVHGEELRFSEAGLKEMVRKVLLPLWNAYTFLATYASVDGWDPDTDYVKTRDSELDQWILIKLERLKNEIQTEMELFHLARTVPPLLNFIDDLTNWYIRRSRRRFWKSENDGDKNQAYSTLYSVLLDFTKLAAPFIPFITEEIYQRLRVGSQHATKDSIHLETYPQPRKLSEEERVAEQTMDEIRQIVFLGRELREKMKIKTRQPLDEIFIGILEPKDQARLERLSPIVLEELNVKHMRFVPFKEMAGWTVKPNFRVIGQKLGAQLPQFQKAAAALTELQVFDLLSGKPISLIGSSFEPDAFLLQLHPQEKFKHPTHSLGHRVIALNTVITQNLEHEGFAREVVHAVQNMRKESGFNVSDRIQLHVSVTGPMSDALKTFKSFIELETLSTLNVGSAPHARHQSSETLNGSTVTFAIE